MRYMMMLMTDQHAEARPDPRLLAEMGKFIQEMTRAGVLLTTSGLAPTSQSTRIRASDGQLTLVDGPFAEVKEVIGGFAIVQTRSKDEALEWGKRFMKIHQDILGPTWQGVSEVRQLFGPEEACPQGPSI